MSTIANSPRHAQPKRLSLAATRTSGGSGWLPDLLLAIAVATFAVVALIFELGEGGTQFTPAAGAVAVVGGTAIAWRRRQATAVLVVVSVARVIVTIVSGNELAMLPAMVIALFTVARQRDRRRGVVVAVTAALVTGVAVAALDDEAFLLELLGEAGQLLLPIAVSDAARTRADRVRELIDSEADRRVQAERLRIARDLHDLVAHGLSTMTIQAGVAGHLLDGDSDVDHARQALDNINILGKTSLEELRSMLGVLRSTDEVPLRPTPADPNDLSDLIECAAATGVIATTQVHGVFPTDVASSVVVAAHRIIQEALNNVARHAGTVETIVRLEHCADELQIVVDNEPPRLAPSPKPSTGVGIIGMAERAESLGGSLRAASRPDGGYSVTATLPYYRHHR